MIATGAWSRVFCKALDITIPVAPARGQMLAVTTIRRLLRRPINSSKGALVPRADGSVHVGATVEHVGFDKRNTPEAIADLLERGTTVIPALSDGRVERMWSGSTSLLRGWTACDWGTSRMGECLGCGGALHDGYHRQSDDGKDYQGTDSRWALG